MTIFMHAWEFIFSHFALCLADEVRVWVYEEILPSGDKLTEVINTKKVLI
jgi:hypothetical protein